MRIAWLDCVRVLATTLVLLCHWGQSLGQGSWGVAGGVANCIFFVLSGFCLGFRWRENGCHGFGMVFAKRRFYRLYAPFFVFVAAYTVILANSEGLDSVSTLMNFLMLSWFFKLPGAGHLWFVTGMALTYVVLMGVSRIGERMGKRQLLVAMFVSLFCVSAQSLLAYVGIRQAYFLTMLWGSVVAFLFGGKVHEVMQNSRLRWLVLQVTIVVAALLITLLVAHWKALEGHMVLYYWLCMAVAMATMVLMMVIKVNRPLPTVGFLAMISYEIYLVHYPLCSDSPLFLLRLAGNAVAYGIMLLAASLLFGFVLHIVGNSVSRVINR